MKRSKTRLVFISLLLWYTFFLCQKINLVTADLGRHLINGRVFWQTGQIIRTNFYSYTNPDFLVINHHWGSGVIFALVEKFFGFSGLSVLFILVSLISFALIYYLAQQHARPGWLLLTGLLLMPIIAERVEIRPEVFFLLIYRDISADTQQKARLLAIADTGNSLGQSAYIFFPRAINNFNLLAV